ncbi:hypothetical protein OQA88_13179 [Cercophora sp. LCS_1]
MPAVGAGALGLPFLHRVRMIGKLRARLPPAARRPPPHRCPAARPCKTCSTGSVRWFGGGRVATMMPDPEDLGNGGMQNDTVRRRHAIRLATTERDPKTGSWSARALSGDAVYHPPDGSYTLDTSTDPEVLKKVVSLNYWDLGSTFGSVVTTRLPDPKLAGWPNVGVWLIGEFGLSGSRSVPRTHASRYYGSPTRFSLTPDMIGTTYRAHLYTSRSTIAPNIRSAFAKDEKGVLPLTPSLKPRQILCRRTHGNLRVAASSQLSAADLFSWANQFRLRRTGLEDNAAGFEWLLPTGTFVPFFMSGNRNKSLAFTPTFDTHLTVSGIYDLLFKALAFAGEYIGRAADSSSSSLNDGLQADAENDPRFNELVAVWENLWDQALTPKCKVTTFYHPLMGVIRRALSEGGTA